MRPKDSKELQGGKKAKAQAGKVRDEKRSALEVVEEGAWSLRERTVSETSLWESHFSGSLYRTIKAVHCLNEILESGDSTALLLMSPYGLNFRRGVEERPSSPKRPLKF